MAVTDPVAIRFANERVRRAAEALYRNIAEAKGIIQQWLVQGMASRFPDDGTQLADGSPGDGRPPATGADVHRLIEALQAIVTAADAQASNGQTHAANALKIAPNPGLRQV